MWYIIGLQEGWSTKERKEGPKNIKEIREDVRSSLLADSIRFKHA